MLKINNIPAITEDTRKYMGKALDSIFSHKEGSDLNSVVSEVLNDRDVFLFLMNYLDKDDGVLLGRMKCWDDATVYIPYGITINHGPRVPRTTLFAYRELMTGVDELGLYDRMPTFRLIDNSEDIPSPEEFALYVNRVLQQIGQIEDNPFIIDLSKIPKKFSSAA